MSKLNPKSSLPPKLHQVLAELRLEIPEEHELAEGRSVMAALIGEWIASVETITEVFRQNPLCCLVYKEDGKITGVVSFLLLRPAGLLAIATDKFNGVAPDVEMIATPDEAPTAGYGWALAAKSRKAAAAVLLGLDKVRGEVFPQIPFFARAATQDGRRVLCGRLRYIPFPRSDTGLLWSAPLTAKTEGVQ